MRIGIGSGSSYKAVVVANFLKRNYHNHYIIAFDKHHFFQKVHSKHYDHVIQDDNFFSSQKYLELMNNNKIDIMIPVDSSEYKLIYSNPDLLETKQLSYIGNRESFELLNNKIKLHEFAEKLEINVPISYYNDQTKITPGTVVKPLDLTSAEGVMYVKSKKDVPTIVAQSNKHGDFIVQKYIHGTGVGLSLFAQNGEILSMHGHKRLAEFPVTGGSSAYRTNFQHEMMLDITQKIITATNWSGFAMFEFKLTPDNEIYLIEVNPRVWGSINQGLANGTNYFENIFGKTESPQKKKNVNTYLSPTIYLSLVKYLLNFHFAPLKNFLKNTFNNQADVNMFQDPGGYLGLLLRKLQ